MTVLEISKKIEEGVEGAIIHHSQSKTFIELSIKELEMLKDAELDRNQLEFLLKIAGDSMTRALKVNSCLCKDCYVELFIEDGSIDYRVIEAYY
jgi:hypothetical protein